MPQDSWPLRQLENSQTPVLVSQLEGLTSANWSMPHIVFSARMIQVILSLSVTGRSSGGLAGPLWVPRPVLVSIFGWAL